MTPNEFINAYLSRINFGTLCLATLLFFLPWTNVQCAGQRAATQSGVQAIYAGVSVDPSIERQSARAERGGEDPSDDIGFGFIMLICFLSVAGGAASAGVVLFKRMDAPVSPGMLAAVVILLLLFQSIIGFPIDRAVRRGLQRERPPGEIDAPVPIATERTGWFYMELLLLAIPAALYVNSRYPITPYLSPGGPQGAAGAPTEASGAVNPRRPSSGPGGTSP
ncbi:MAG: hypothetical protein ACREJC_09000 [Tepidisphaeraceae bacterium]